MMSDIGSSGYAERFPLHFAAARRDLRRARSLLEGAGGEAAALANAYDEQGRTPLLLALRGPWTLPDLVRSLLEAGARTDLLSKEAVQGGRTPLSVALGAGDPRVVRLLVESGADPHDQSPHGCGAVHYALHDRAVQSDARLIELLAYLIGLGCDLNTVSEYGESPLRVLSRLARFDALSLLLDAGADETQLAWTPLHRAVALGTVEDVEALARGGAPLESRDVWGRTPWLLAVAAGNLAMAQRLAELGADTAARGRGDQTALQHALAAPPAGRRAMCLWLVAAGQQVDPSHGGAVRALHDAVERDDVDLVRALVSAGVPLDAQIDSLSAYFYAHSANMARCLLDLGAAPSRLRAEAWRALAGLPTDEDEAQLAGVSLAEHERGRRPRYGERNPDPLPEPYCVAMVRAGVSAFAGRGWFLGLQGALDESPSARGAGWSAQRFGQSYTLLPDGRWILIGGEHEDFYDPDFWIYNDVIVLEPGGAIRIYGYPAEEFAPTDWHSATLLGSHIYVIGCLGYQGARGGPDTPVYRLDTTTLRMERLLTSGESPGWIGKHRATVLDSTSIRVEGGKVVRTAPDGTETWADNHAAYRLDTQTLNWTRATP